MGGGINCCKDMYFLLILNINIEKKFSIVAFNTYY